MYKYDISQRRITALPRLACPAAALWVISAFHVATAQTFPMRPVRLVVGLAAGGPTDVVARLYASKLSELWKQPVVVENRVGAGSTIAAELVSKATPDGHTLLNCSVATHGISPALYKKLAYDPLKHFAPIAQIGTTPNILVAHPGIAAKTVSEFVARAKASPGKLFYGSSGVGASPHLTMELLKSRTGINVVHVPFKGSSLAMPEILAGRVHVMFDNLPGQVTYVQTGKLRGLGVTSLQRSTQLPEIPTIAESGIAGFEVTIWYGTCAPASTPTPVIAKIHADSVSALNTTDLRQRLADLGVETSSLSTKAFTGLIAAELKKWAVVVKDAGIQAE